jgi:SAM-dependent methyltransferase
LEIGCGQGRLGEAFKSRQPKVQYFGVELMPQEAKLAQGVLAGVLCADIEQNTSLPQEFLQAAEKFDALVFGDVLEHLRDPWRVLSELRNLMTPDGTCVACVPNVGHWSLVRQLLSGRWDYADSGLLDRTHVRFFTLETAVEMFQKAGWRVTDASPRNMWPEKTEQAIKDLLPILEQTAQAGKPLLLIAEDIEAYLHQHEHKSLLRFITCGSVDDGKSTLIGRLLVDSRAVLQDQLASVSRSGETDLALLTDGLSAERAGGTETLLEMVDRSDVLGAGIEALRRHRVGVPQRFGN